MVDTLNVEGSPADLEYNFSNDYIYVANSDQDSVSVIIDDNAMFTVELQSNPVDLEYNHANKNMYVAGFETVSVIDSDDNTVVATVDVGSDPVDLEYSPLHDSIYVANQGSDDVSVIGIGPITDAGPDQTVNSGEAVQLDGSGSLDPSGESLTYQWTQTFGPSVTLSDPTSVNPTFTAPNVLLQRDLVFELVVTNEAGIQSEPDSVTIIVVSNFDGIVGSGNNVNIQVQENSDNNVAGQSGGGSMYSDSPIFQRQSTDQDSRVVS